MKAANPNQYQDIKLSKSIKKPMSRVGIQSRAVENYSEGNQLSLIHNVQNIGSDSSDEANESNEDVWSKM